MTLSNPTVRARLSQVAPNVVPLLYDADYACPTSDWLFNKFAPWFRANYPQYTRKRDCDNFARRLAVDAQDLHAESDNEAEALAVGEFCYIGSSHVKGPHIINFAFVDAGDLVFLEPQNAMRLSLTPLELMSCYHIAM